MLEYFITSKAKRNLLKLFLTNPEKAFYVRETARLTGEPLNAVRRELGYLEKAGLLKSRREVNVKYFKVVKEFPIYHELKSIISSTVGIGGRIRDRLRDIKSIELAFIYGPVDKVEKGEKKDLALFVVGNIIKEDFHRMASEIEREIGREISYTIMTRKEYIGRTKMGDPYLKKIEREEKSLVKGYLDISEESG